MKNLSILTASVLLLLLVGGCDFFRTLAGRPTSAEINAKRARIELVAQREAALRDSVERARKDSIAFAQKAVADSLHAVDTLTHIGKLHKASSYRNIPQSRLRSQYALVVGVFSTEQNAERAAARYSEDGFEAYVLKYYSRLCAVLVSPRSRVADILSEYRKVRKLPYASSEIWVLVNE